MNARLLRSSLSCIAALLLVCATPAVVSGQRQLSAAPKRLSSRIVGGLPANDIDIPYIVSLVTYGFHSCGGSIVNERTVITAAHCLAYTAARLLKVHAGAKSRSLDEGVLIAVQAIHFNDEWNMVNMDYDIGLVRLTESLVYSAAIQPIRLPRSDEVVPDGSYATVAGWGYTSMLGPGSQVLRYARVPIIKQESCNRLLSGQVTERMICAGFIKGGIDACQMDSGGPLVLQQTLVGIVSWGIGCAMPGRPGVYSRVTALRPWLDDVLATEYNETL